jgi:hypothetical protein
VRRAEALVDAVALAREREAVTAVELEEPAAERIRGQRAERMVACRELRIGLVAVRQDPRIERALELAAGDALHVLALRVRAHPVEVALAELGELAHAVDAAAERLRVVERARDAAFVHAAVDERHHHQALHDVLAVVRRGHRAGERARIARGRAVVGRAVVAQKVAVERGERRAVGVGQRRRAAARRDVAHRGEDRRARATGGIGQEHRRAVTSIVSSAS